MIGKIVKVNKSSSIWQPESDPGIVGYHADIKKNELGLVVSVYKYECDTHFSTTYNVLLFRGLTVVNGSYLDNL